MLFRSLGIYEIMKITPPIKRLISKKAEADAIKKQAISEGMNTLKMAASNAVKEGVTTIAEMVKATYEAEEDDAQSRSGKKPSSGKDSLSDGKITASTGNGTDNRSASDSSNDIVEIELEQID